jgi:cytochrome c-type biogenesis protein CcmH/NrfG
MPLPAHDSAGHDAQRELEHRALRNVRGLVDRMEAEERAKGRSQKWIAVGLVAIAVVLIGAILALISYRKSEEARELTVTPVSNAPAR